MYLSIPIACIKWRRPPDVFPNREPSVLPQKHLRQKQMLMQAGRGHLEECEYFHTKHTGDSWGGNEKLQSLRNLCFQTEWGGMFTYTVNDARRKFASLSVWTYWSMGMDWGRQKCKHMKNDLSFELIHRRCSSGHSVCLCLAYTALLRIHPESKGKTLWIQVVIPAIQHFAITFHSSVMKNFDPLNHKVSTWTWRIFSLTAELMSLMLLCVFVPHFRASSVLQAYAQESRTCHPPLLYHSLRCPHQRTHFFLLWTEWQQISSL